MRKHFAVFYYLKEELVVFCRENKLPTSGGKIEIAERIACFLDAGEVLSVSTKTKAPSNVASILDTEEIEPDFVCTEKHRNFFKERIGKSFSFNVAFQKWLKENADKNYSEAIAAYYDILEKKKKGKTTIDKQSEYNAYIRDFLANNTRKSLEEAIRCWKYKKSMQGHNRYETPTSLFYRNYCKI